MMPDCTFKKYWNVVMIFLLIYVGVYMPYGVCFNQKQPGDGMGIMDYVDIAVDMFLIVVDETEMMIFCL